MTAPSLAAQVAEDGAEFAAGQARLTADPWEMSGILSEMATAGVEIREIVLEVNPTAVKRTC